MGKSLHKNGKYLVHNSEGKLTNKRISLKEGQKITVDRMLMNGRSCWRMKGTNDYLWGSEIKKFPLQSLGY